MAAGAALAALTWAGPAAAQEATAGTPTEFYTRWTTGTVTGLTLTADITLTCDRRPRPAGSAALTVEGGGFTIRQTCTGAGRGPVLESAMTNLLTVNRVTLTGGAGLAGGGISAAGPVTLNNSTISDNRADRGGGIYTSSGAVTLNGSTIAGNSAANTGGAIVTAGAVNLTNSTVAGNRTTAGGTGGIFADGGVTLVYATVAGNTGTPANITTGATLTSYGSVVGRRGDQPNCATGTTASQGHNASDDTSCDFDQTTDQQDVADPRLGALAANGGQTPTLLPARSSPLVDRITDCDTGTAAGITADQRGTARPAGDGCDIGAVERSAPTGPVTGAVTDDAADGTLPLTGPRVRTDLVATAAVLIGGGILLRVAARRRPWRRPRPSSRG